MVDPAPIASITEHLRGAYGFTMKSAANGSLFRVLPLRDPDQPRFWCIVVVRMSPGGETDRSHPAWIGRRGLRREELAEIMAAIRDDLELWLADPAQKALRHWLMTPGAAAGVIDAAKPSSPSRSVILSIWRSPVDSVIGRLRGLRHDGLRPRRARAFLACLVSGEPSRPALPCHWASRVMRSMTIVRGGPATCRRSC